jgi:hypothetical protein
MYKNKASNNNQNQRHNAGAPPYTKKGADQQDGAQEAIA